MNRRTIAIACVVGSLTSLALPARAEDPPKPRGDDSRKVDFEPLSFPSRGGGGGGDSNPLNKFRNFDELVRGAEKFDGLFTLYKKDDHLFADIKPYQFDQPLLAPIVISKGMAMAGNPLNFGEEWVIVFHRAGDRVQVIRRNVHYKATPGTPIEKAVKQNYTDSVIMALPIQSLNPAGGMSVVVDLGDIFFTDFAQLGLGYLDRSRSSWHKIKAYPNNLELQVEATFSGGGRSGGSGGGDDGVTDARGNTLVIHYSLVKLPEPGYHVRYADDRVGHFLNATKDFNKVDPDTNFVRMINRWRIEKADPSAKLSPPKRRMIWWVENTVPDEYRPYVQSGIEEWNKAFEPLGIRNAIEVRWQTDRDEFDPEDIDHCTFRWITTNQTYAMSCLRSNPMTGEMIDGDVIFDAGFIKSFKQEYALLTGTGPASIDRGPIAVGEILSPIMAAKVGYGLPIAPRAGKGEVEVRPASWTDLQVRLRQRMSGSVQGGCQFSAGMQYEMGLAALAMADAGKAEAGGVIPEEFIGQAIKMIVMHEVGHSLGLRHNFKASTMLSGDDLNNTELTRKKGLVGSVMEYSPINLAPKGKKQGDYYTTTLGPYDYWAIEYAYRPIDGNEESELKKIAARAPEPDLTFATDDDMYGGNDPRVNVWDLGDPCQFAVDRMDLASELLKDLDAKSTKDGQSWAKNRDAFAILLSQFGNSAYLAASFIGGQSVHRDHKGDKNGRDPVVPIQGAKQREALRFLIERTLSDKSFQFSPALLRRLGTEKWYHWGSSSMYDSADVAILQRVLGIQKIALNHCLSGSTLATLQNQEFQTDPGSDPLKMAEVFRALTDGVWSELNLAPDAKDFKLSTIRRNLQREHFKRLSTMVLGEKAPNYGSYGYVIFLGGAADSVPADARALARLHLRQIGERIGKILDNKALSIDDTTRAHLEETKHKIAKVLDAGLDSNEP